MTSTKKTSATNGTESAARPRFLTIAQVADELSVNEPLVRGLVFRSCTVPSGLESPDLPPALGVDPSQELLRV